MGKAIVVIFISLFFLSSTAFAKDTSCESKVIADYKAIKARILEANNIGLFPTGTLFRSTFHEEKVRYTKMLKRCLVNNYKEDK